MIQNKFYNKKTQQKRIEDKFDKYYKAIESEKVRSILDQMPKTQNTLDIIENELREFILHVEGESEKDKWSRLVTGVNAINKIKK